MTNLNEDQTKRSFNSRALGSARLSPPFSMISTICFNSRALGSARLPDGSPLDGIEQFQFTRAGERATILTASKVNHSKFQFTRAGERATFVSSWR